MIALGKYSVEFVDLLILVQLKRMNKIKMKPDIQQIFASIRLHKLKLAKILRRHNYVPSVF